MGTHRSSQDEAELRGEAPALVERTGEFMRGERRAHPRVINPLSWEECPDPSIVHADGDIYIATTHPEWWDWMPGQAMYPLRRAVGSDFREVETIGHVFPAGEAPSWVQGDPWAPELHYDEGMGYAVSFTARNGSGPLCIGIALADHPEGPYRELREGPFLESPHIGVIDAHIFYDERAGRRWLYWKEDWNDRPSAHRRTPIFACELMMTADGPALVGEPVKVLENDLPMEGDLVEGASVVERDGRYYMFYSAGPYNSGAYLTSVAVGPTPVGPFTKLGENLMPNDACWEGRGHGFVATDGEERDWFVCHGYPTGDLRRRVLLVFPIHWGDDGWPRIDTHLDVHEPPDTAPPDAGIPRPIVRLHALDVPNEPSHAPCTEDEDR
jgi:beta-xylosidase